MENINGNQPNKPLTDLKNGRISLGFVLTAMMLVLVGLTGIVPTSLQSLAILGVMTMMAFTGEVYLVYPIMLFYGYRLGTLAGVTVYRWYTMLFLGITFLRSRSIKLNVKQLLVFGLFGIYCLAAICPWSLRSGIFAVLDMAGILVLITAYLKQPDKLKYFFTVYVLCAFVAYFTGTRLEGLQYNAVIGGEYVELVRNMSTFEDPNYNSYRSIEALPRHIFEEMQHFFSVYKQLEGKETAVNEVQGHKAAAAVIEQCIKNYKEKFGDDTEVQA